MKTKPTSPILEESWTKEIVKRIKKIQKEERFQDYGWADLERDLDDLLAFLEGKGKE